MKKLLSLYLIFASISVWSQVTPTNYPYAKPIPTNGQNSAPMTYMSTALGPSYFQNLYPVIWAPDVGGGFRSVLNATERTNLKFTIEGQLVYDASDQAYYRVGTGRVATIPLLSSYLQTTNYNNIYLGNGTLSGARVLDGNLFSLSFTNLGRFDLSSKVDMYHNTPSKIYMTADGIDITGTNNFNLDGAAQFTISAKTLDAIAIERVTIGAQIGPVYIAGTIITNSAGQYYIIATNGMNVFTRGTMNLNADNVYMVGTNGFTVNSLGQFYVNGKDVYIQGQTNTTLGTSAGKLHLYGTTITNWTGHYDIISTNGMNILTAGSMYLNADQVNLIGTNGFNLQSAGQTSINGQDVYLIGQTNLFLGSGNGKIHITGLTITNYTGHYDIIATNGMLINVSGPNTNNTLQIMAPNTSITGNLIQTNGRVQLNGNSLVDIHSGNNMNVTSDGVIISEAGTIFSLKAGTSLLLTGTNQVSIDSSAIKLKTPAVKAGTAKTNQVAKLINVDGTIEFGANEISALVVTNFAALAGVNTIGYNYAATLGYYLPGDLGNGNYQLITYNASEDTYSNIRSTVDNTKMWSLMPEYTGRRIRQYGAKGDGTTDDTAPVAAWLLDSNQGNAIADNGVYLIAPLTPAAGNYVIRGSGAFPLVARTTQNTPTFKRKLTPGQEAVSLFNVTAGTSLSLYNIALDGNKAVETAATGAYLYLNGGSASEISGCYFLSSAGHGVGFAGSTSFSSINNCRFYDVARAIRCNSVGAVKISNIRAERTTDNAISIVSGHDCSISDVHITDGGLNGIVLSGSGFRILVRHARINSMFQSCILLDISSAGLIYGVKISDCELMNANILNNALGTSPFGPALYSTFMVTGTATGDSSLYGTVENCFLGDVSSAGLSRSKYTFEWVQPAGGAQYPWKAWSFVNNKHLWNPNWVADYSPALTNTVSEIGVLRVNGEMNSMFGKSGAINSTGWRMDIVEGAGSTTTDLLNANPTSHKMIKTGTGYGTPVAFDAADRTLPVSLPQSLPVTPP